MIRKEEGGNCRIRCAEALSFLLMNFNQTREDFTFVVLLYMISDLQKGIFNLNVEE